MPPEQDLPPSVPSVSSPLPPNTGRRHVSFRAAWIVLALVLLGLVVVILPLFHAKIAMGAQATALGRAHQIGMGLKIFAADNEGNFPRAGLPEMQGAEVKDSNAAFAVLFPECLTDETLFGNPLSAYQTRPPDNVTDPSYTGKPGKTLEPGENVYSYVAGLTDKSDPLAPLVADGTDGTGHYRTDPKQRGGVWKGRQAIVIHVDDSGSLETLTGPDDARYIPRHGGDDKGNLLDVSSLGPDVRLLDPAIDPQGKR